jgi:hypothetical protein
VPIGGLLVLPALEQHPVDVTPDDHFHSLASPGPGCALIRAALVQGHEENLGQLKLE